MMWKLFGGRPKNQDWVYVPPQPAVRKRRIKILFIDDEQYPVVNILEQAGWENVHRIDDVRDINDIKLEESHVLFVDIQGVGVKMGFRDEGLGLLPALRKTYPKKYIVAYSGESKLSAFESGFNAADHRLPKSAEPIEFMSLLDDFAEAYFTEDNMVSEICGFAVKQGIPLQEERVRHALRTNTSLNGVDSQGVVSSLNLSNVANLASIVDLFMP